MSETSNSPDISLGNSVSLISANLFISLVFERIIEKIGCTNPSNFFKTSSVGKYVG